MTVYYWCFCVMPYVALLGRASVFSLGTVLAAVDSCNIGVHNFRVNAEVADDCWNCLLLPIAIVIFGRGEAAKGTTAKPKAATSSHVCSVCRTTACKALPYLRLLPLTTCHTPNQHSTTRRALQAWPAQLRTQCKHHITAFNVTSMHHQLQQQESCGSRGILSRGHRVPSPGERCNMDTGDAEQDETSPLTLPSKLCCLLASCQGTSAARYPRELSSL